MFRSCAAVEVAPDGTVTFSLGTRIRFKNLFGRFYIAAIDAVHRSYVAPSMLNFAVDWVLRPPSFAGLMP